MVLAKALWFVAPRCVEIRKEVLPPITQGKVMVETMYSGISAGTEMLVYRGEVPEGLELDAVLTTLAGSFPFPVKYGYASVGRVVATADDCRSLREGDIVFALAPHQTALIIDEEMCVKLPHGIKPEHGVFLANLEAAIGIVHDSAVILGEVAIVIGLGVVGLLSLALLKMSGAYVIGVDRLESRREAAKMMGAEAVYSPGEDFRDHLLGLTDDGCPDIVIEASGSPAALQQAIDLSGLETRIIVASWYGKRRVELNMGEKFHRNRLCIKSSQVSRLNPILSARWRKQRRLRLAAGILKSLPLERLITHRIPFSEARRAYELLDKNPEEALQIVLEYT